MVMYRKQERQWHQQTTEAMKDSNAVNPHLFPPHLWYWPSIWNGNNSFSSLSVVITLPLTMWRSMHKIVSLHKVQNLATIRYKRSSEMEILKKAFGTSVVDYARRQSCNTIHQENKHTLGWKWFVTLNRNVLIVQCPKDKLL